jgi:hypothetical protein
MTKAELNEKRLDLVLELASGLNHYTLPRRDIIVGLIDRLTVRSGAWRRSRPKGSRFTRPKSEADTMAVGAVLLWDCLRWHSGAGNLGSYPLMFPPRGLDGGFVDSIDTLAILLCGGQSKAASRWSKAFGEVHECFSIKTFVN